MLLVSGISTDMGGCFTCSNILWLDSILHVSEGCYSSVLHSDFPLLPEKSAGSTQQASTPPKFVSKTEYFLKPASFSLCAKQFNTFLILFVTKRSCEMLFKNLVGFLITVLWFKNLLFYNVSVCAYKNSQYSNQSGNRERIGGTGVSVQWLWVNVQWDCDKKHSTLLKYRHNAYSLGLFMWFSNYIFFLVSSSPWFQLQMCYWFYLFLL